MYVLGHLYKQVQDWNGNVNVIQGKAEHVVGIMVKSIVGVMVLGYSIIFVHSVTL